MKIALVLLLSLCFVGCEYSVLETSICQGQLEDIKGFEGDFESRLGDSSQEVAMSVTRLGLGHYKVVTRSSKFPTQRHENFTCRVGGQILIEQPIKNNKWQVLFKARLTSNGLVLETATFDKDLLLKSNIDYVVTDDSVFGIKRYELAIENQNISPEDLLSLQGVSSTEGAATVEYFRK
jgi:hypothetical protein